MSPDIITAIASTVAASGVIFIAWQALSNSKQARNSSRQIKLDHERSRREAAINLMKYWNELAHDLLPSMHIRRMIEELDINQCEKLFLGKPVSINKCNISLIESFFSSIPLVHNKELKIEDGSIHLDELQTHQVCTHFSLYMNVLEIVATAWRHNIVDREIIEDEFRKIFFKNQCDFRYACFIKASGIYPSIHEFIDHAKNKLPKNINKQSLE